MNDGFWINYATGKTVPIHEHETDIRKPDVMKKLGIPAKDLSDFGKFKLGTDRERFLMFLIKKYPLMRVRGHGVAVTFDFDSHSRSAAIDAIYDFAENNLGPFSSLSINNYATKEHVDISFQEFKDLLDSDGPEGVLRYGSEKANKHILKELKKIAAEIDMKNLFKK